MEFEWDEGKAKANADKHGVSFHEAASLFGDPLAITFSAPDHSTDEDRYITFGLSKFDRPLVASHAEREGRMRIISARNKKKKERKFYEEK